MTKGTLRSNAGERIVRSFAAFGLLGLAACSSGSETTIPETVPITEASIAVTQPPPTSDVLGGLVASGTVTCPGGMPVAGVWVETAQEDRGWADWQPHADDPEVADYSRNLNQSVGYGLNVGCGGTPESWGQSIQVDGLVAGIPAVLVCEQTTGEGPAPDAYVCVPEL